MADTLRLIAFYCDHGYGETFRDLESAHANVLVMEDDVSGLLDRLREKRAAMTRKIKRGIGVAIENTVICITDSPERLPGLIGMHNDLRGKWSATATHVIILAREHGGGADTEKFLSSLDGAFGLSVFYIRYDDLTPAELRGFCASLIDVGISRKRLSDGFYFICASVGYFGEFSLFFELSSRRLEEAGKRGALSAGVESVRAFAKKIVDDRFRKVDAEAFRYIMWDCSFENGFYPAGYYKDSQPFAENSQKFIKINCSGRFRQYVNDAARNEGALSKRFFDGFVEDFDGIIGEARVAIMSEALYAFKAAGADVDKEIGGASIDAGSKPRVHETEDLWAYASYMYKNYFTRKMDLERLQCESELIVALCREIETAASREKENLDVFYGRLREKREIGNSFAQRVYDKIGELFKINPDAERYLLARIREYVATLKASADDTGYGRALFAPSAAKFLSAVSGYANAAFDHDTADRFVENARGFIVDSLAPPALLLDGYTFDNLRGALNADEPELRSLAYFGGYGDEVAKTLGFDENAVTLFEFYRINAHDSRIRETLRKIL